MWLRETAAAVTVVALGLSFLKRASARLAAAFAAFIAAFLTLLAFLVRLGEPVLLGPFEERRRSVVPVFAMFGDEWSGVAVIYPGESSARTKPAGDLLLFKVE